MDSRSSSDMFYATIPLTGKPSLRGANSYEEMQEHEKKRYDAQLEFYTETLNYLKLSRKEIAEITESCNKSSYKEPRIMVDGIANYGRLFWTGNWTVIVYEPGEHVIYYSGSRHALHDFGAKIVKALKLGVVKYQILDSNAPSDMYPYETRDEYFARKYSLSEFDIHVLTNRVKREYDLYEGLEFARVLGSVVKNYAKRGYIASKEYEAVYMTYKRAQRGELCGHAAMQARKDYFDSVPDVHGIFSAFNDIHDDKFLSNFTKKSPTPEQCLGLFEHFVE